MSYTKLLYHMVFATKARAPMITPALKSDLHGYLGGIVRKPGGTALEINGVADHVHLLATVPPTISVSVYIGKLKANSSRWANVKTNGRFAWQLRYGAFTVSESQVERLKEYIREQEEHHKRITFEEEYRSLLRLHGVEFDEEHLWS
jgi:putative transposase